MVCKYHSLLLAEFTTLTVLNINVQNEAIKDQLLVKTRSIEDLRGLPPQVRDLEVPLKNTEDEYNRIMNQIAPLSSIPDEILANIFEVGHVPPSLLSPRAGSASHPRLPPDNQTMSRDMWQLSFAVAGGSGSMCIIPRASEK